VLLLALLVSGCTYTINYTIVWFEPNSVGENATVDLSMDSQFATTKTVSPSTDLSVPISALKEMNKQMKALNRELNPPKE
jgi:hypothetical protein